jgi:16S rRNA (cytidine1402-2'-O)-methyltransferase
MTFRGVRILKEAAVIACEDTRETRKLLDHFGIEVAMVSYHEHNEGERAAELLARLQAGETVALVSDAGTPLISDPGYRLVRAAVGAGIQVVSTPGASAALTALAASGLPTDAFVFAGFLPAKTGQRRKELERWKDVPATLIFYETPHRILDCLSDITAVLGTRPVVLGRELTKIHEEMLRGTADELLRELEQRPSVRGEFTVLIGKGDGVAVADDQPVEQAVRSYMDRGMSQMDAVKTVARERGLGKREVYARLVGR